MLRLSCALRRTSRRGPGSWSNPVLASPTVRVDQVPRYVRGAAASGRPAERAGHTSSSDHYSGSERATRPPVNWRAEPGRDKPWAADPLYQRVSRPAPHDSESHDARGSSAGSKSTTWLGGEQPGATSVAATAMQRHLGVDDFSMVDRQKLTLTRLARIAMDATFRPRDADSRAFGGDNSTRRAEQREELKTMDQRIVPFTHDELMNDYLKNITQLRSPSGQLYHRDLLKGRLVGMLFFTESERSLAFMRHLRHVHQKHSPDFVVVAFSIAGKEMTDVTSANGFYHCTHRHGATWVARDAGLMVRPLMPLPRLIIVDGTTGVEVTRSGVTAVLANPDSCFSAWRRGESGCRFRDWLKSIYI